MSPKCSPHVPGAKNPLLPNDSPPLGGFVARVNLACVERDLVAGDLGEFQAEAVAVQVILECFRAEELECLGREDMTESAINIVVAQCEMRHFESHPTAQ
jgi:hypothetical protein